MTIYIPLDIAIAVIVLASIVAAFYPKTGPRTRRAAWAVVLVAVAAYFFRVGTDGYTALGFATLVLAGACAIDAVFLPTRRSG